MVSRPAAIPYGMVVSHIIVLFEFIEERHALGEPFREAMLDSGILRLRPVLITVGATIIALFPLAYSGGPLWGRTLVTRVGVCLDNESLIELSKKRRRATLLLPLSVIAAIYCYSLSIEKRLVEQFQTEPLDGNSYMILDRSPMTSVHFMCTHGGL